MKHAVMNYYSVLGIPKTASQADIEQSYLKRMSFNPGAYDREDIERAYFFLGSTPELRAWYDAELDRWPGLTKQRPGWPLNREWQEYTDRHWEHIRICVHDGYPHLILYIRNLIAQRIPPITSPEGSVLAKVLLVLGPLIGLILVLDAGLLVKLFHGLAGSTEVKGRCADGSPSAGSLLGLPVAVINFVIGLFALVAFPGGLIYGTIKAYDAVTKRSHIALESAALATIVSLGSVLLFALGFQLMHSLTTLGC